MKDRHAAFKDTVMRSAEKLLIHALFILFPIYTIVVLFPYESAVSSPRDLRQRGK